MAELSLKRRFFCKIIELWMRSLRISVKISENLNAAGVLALWHRDLFAGAAAFRKRGIAAFISPSADGELLAKISADLGYRVVRGSSSRESLSIREMLRLLQSGKVCAMALDGPRGPAGEEKPGTRWLAKLAQVPAWKVSVQYGAHFTLHSWDAAKIPLPLSKLTISLSYL